VNPACHLFDLNKTATRFVAPRANAKSNQLDFIGLVKSNARGSPMAGKHNYGGE
jgi:hypothetical protein